jgi:hypothetical protein
MAPTSGNQPKRPSNGLLRGLIALLRGLLMVLAAVVLLIEEWGWRPLTALAARLARWPPLARLEARIQAAPPRVALLLFLVPATLLFPLKLLALWLLQRHHPWLGLLLIIGAKLVGTAAVGRLFIISEAQLMTFPWFAWALGWWRATKLRIHRSIVSNPVWQGLQRAQRMIRISTRRQWRRWFR